MNDTSTLRVRFYHFDGHENAPALRAFLALGKQVLKTIGTRETIAQRGLPDPQWRRLIVAEWHASDIEATDHWLALRHEGHIEILEQVNVP